MKLSVVVPAFNEAKRIESCLERLTGSLRETVRSEWNAEIIVVDNNSTDATADLARSWGARVVFEPINQIARARNAGAAASGGDWLLFVDADTLVSAATLKETLDLVDAGGSVGAGSILRFDRLDWVGRVFVALSNPVIRMLRLTCGCYVLCRADAFRLIGGFNQAMYAGEDADFGQRLKRWAKPHGLRLDILRRHPPVTSFRKVDLYGWGEALKLIFRWLVFRRRTTRDKKYLRLFYDGRR